VIEELVHNPSQSLGNMRRADEHRILYVEEKDEKET